MFKTISKKTVIIVLAILLAGGGVILYRTRNFGKMISGSASKNSAVQQSTAPLKTRVKHIFIVLEENHPYSSVMGNTKDMPYLNELANRYAYAKNYYANSHPSIGNYFMLTAGDIITKKDSFSDTVTEDNIIRSLASSGKTWKEYSESLPSVGYTGGDAGGYEEHHNPLSYFSDVRGNSVETANLVPLSQLAADIANNTLPDYSFIVPNEQNDAHSCPSQGNCSNSQKLAAADEWLKNNINPLIDSQEFSTSGGGLLIITFDESSKSDKIGGGGHVAWVAVGPNVKKGYASEARYQHENTLRFMAESIGLTDFPGKSASADNMTEFLAGN